MLAELADLRLCALMSAPLCLHPYVVDRLGHPPGYAYDFEIKSRPHKFFHKNK